METVRVNAENLPGVIEDFETGLLEELSGRDLEFCNDLINGKYGFKKRGYLSDKQINWIEIFYKRALGIEEKPEVETVGELTGLIDLFTEALGKLKFPKIKLEINGYPLRLSLAGPKSKYHGSIMITDGKPYGENKWYGTVSPSGTWTPSKAVTPELRPIIARTLTAFSNDDPSTPQ